MTMHESLQASDALIDLRAVNEVSRLNPPRPVVKANVVHELPAHRMVFDGGTRVTTRQIQEFQFVNNDI